MSLVIESLGIQAPILQAGMGGGVAGHELAAAVSEAGGLGTIGILDPPALRRELARARKLTGRPVAVNLLLPFARAAHWEVAREADVVITFWGPPLRGSAGVWLHQCGSVPEAEAARDAGVDGVIVQGVEAGGHVRGTLPGLELLERVRSRLPAIPVWLAGGVATASDVRQALEAGAMGVVVGTRFLLTPESNAHAEYKRRLLAADRTVLTELFGFGWPAPHRVVPNAATERWLRADGSPPAAVGLVNRVAAPVVGRLSLRTAGRLGAGQRAALPLFGPSPPIVGSPDRLVEAAPLYAGETVRRIDGLLSAAEVVRALST